MRTIYDNVFSSTNPKEVLNFKLEENLIPKRKNGSFFEKDIPYTPVGLCDEIFNMIEPIKNKEFDTKIAVFYSIEMAIWLHFYGFKDVTVITKDHDQYIADRTDSFCYKYLLLDEVGNMKFDVVVGNPPYNSPKTTNSTNSVKLYMQFLAAAMQLSEVVGFVVPSKDTANAKSKLCKILTAGTCIACYDTTPLFDIAYGTCWFVLSPAQNNTTEIRDVNGNIFDIVLSEGDALPLNGSIIKKLPPGTPTLANMWTRSKIYRNDARVGAGNTMMVDSVGAKNANILCVPTTCTPEDFPNFEKWKVMIPNVGAYSEIGNIKIAPPGMGTSYSIVCFNFDTEYDANQMKEYLESSEVKDIVKSIKIVTPNSKALFSNIPLSI